MAKSGAIDRTTAITASDTTVYEAGDMFAVVCSNAGNVVVRLAASAQTYTFPVAVGLTILPFRVIGVNTTSTTATATYANLHSS